MAALAVGMAVLAVLMVLYLCDFRSYRRASAVDRGPGRRLSGRGEVLWVTVTGPAQLGLDCMVTVPHSSASNLMVPIHVAATAPRRPGLGVWMTGLVEQWASRGAPMSMEILCTGRLEAKVKIWHADTSVTLDVRNPLVTRRVLSHSFTDPPGR